MEKLCILSTYAVEKSNIHNQAVPALIIGSGASINERDIEAELIEGICISNKRINKSF